MIVWGEMKEKLRSKYEFFIAFSVIVDSIMGKCFLRGKEL